MGTIIGKNIECNFCAMLPHPLKFTNMFVQDMQNSYKITEHEGK